MRCLFLSTVIGALCAACIALVAALALSVALPLGLGTIHDNAKSAVLSLGRSAVTNLNHAVDVPSHSVKEAGNRLVSVTSGERKGLPTDDPSYNWSTGEPWVTEKRKTVHAAASMGSFAYFMVAASTLDGLSCSGFTLFPTVYTIVCNHRDNATDLDQRRTVLSAHDLPSGASNESHFGAVSSVLSGARFRDASDPAFRALWTNRSAGTPPGEATWGSPVVFARDNMVTAAISVSALLRNSTHVLGLMYIMFETALTGAQLDAARLSSNSEVFLFDANEYIVAASAGLQIYTIDNFTGSDETNGCMTTQASNAFFPSTRAIRACRFHLSNSPHKALTEAYGDAPSMFQQPSKTGVVKEIGGRYVFVQAVTAIKYGFMMSLAVTTPTADFLGSADNILPAACTASSIAVLIGAAVSSALVWTVLRPLLEIAKRMEKAARLEEDDGDEKVSPLAEIGDLQRSFFLLKNELARIRAFVPQSLLRAQSGDEYDDEDDEAHASLHDEVSGGGSSVRSPLTPTTPSGKRSSSGRIGGHTNSMRRSTNTAESPYAQQNSSEGKGTCFTPHKKNKSGLVADTPSSSDTWSHHGAGAGAAAARHPRAALNLATGVKQEQVSVLVLNLCGFHRAVLSGVSADAFGALVSTVLDAAQQEKGVVDSFSGDHFFVSFNAARMAAGHSIRAAKVACRVHAVLAGAVGGAPPQSAQHQGGIGQGSPKRPSDGASSHHYNLPMTAGISTGTAQVGNLGSSTMKRFSIIGPVVSQAAVLERMCKLYDGVFCLVPQRLFEDLQTAVKLHTIDYVKLPGSKTKPHQGTLIGSVKAELSATADDEWMYQLEQQGRQRSASTMAAATSNAVWRELAEGRVEAAVSHWAERQAGCSLRQALSSVSDPSVVHSPLASTPKNVDSSAAANRAEFTLSQQTTPEAESAPKKERPAAILNPEHLAGNRGSAPVQIYSHTNPSPPLPHLAKKAGAASAEWVGPRTAHDVLERALAAAEERRAAALEPPLLPTTLGPFYAGATNTW